MDMSLTTIAKSDQLNADDLVSGPRTITITRVTGNEGNVEQPINVYFDGDNGRPLRPCKTVRRVMIAAWGKESSGYIGRSMTIYNDPKVKWGGMMVGGIRVSHMSHIDHEMTYVFQESKGKKVPITVRPLAGAPGKPETKAENAPPAVIAFTAHDGEIREFQRTLGGMEQYVEAFAMEFGAAEGKAAWFDGNKAAFHDLAVGAVGSRGKSARCEKLAARFDEVAAMINDALTVPVTTADAAAEPTVSKLTVPEIDGRPHWRGFRDEAVAALTAMTPEQRMAWAAMHADEMAGLLAASKKFHGEVENALAGGAA